MKSPLNYLKHIHDELKFLLIESSTLTENEFYSDNIKKRAFVRSFEIIGEATKNISDEFRQKYPSIEWKKMAGFRDRLIHAYFDVDYQIVWQIIKDKLPNLEKDIQEIISKETR